jgi:hypothetical protein
MKLNKLFVFMCMFFLLNIVIVSAADFNPIFTIFGAASGSVTTTAAINMQVRDVSTNAGILWIRLYEDGALLYEKNCAGLTTCSWQVQVDRPAGGTFSYYAQARDKGGKSVTSSTIQVTYNTKNISTCSLVFDPPGPAAPLYGTPVNASCSCDNPEAAAVLTRNGADVTAAENDQYVNLSAAAHDYECSVIETANYMNTTTGSVMYTVDPAPTLLTLTALPSWNEFAGTQTTVSCAADNTEVSVNLYRNGTSVSIPNIQTLDAGDYEYICNSTSSQNYTTATQVSNNLTINKAQSQINLTLNGMASDISVQVGQSVDINATLITPTTGNLEIYEDSILILGETVQDVLEQGQVKTYNVDGKDYEVEVTYIGGTPSGVKFKVNGEVTDTLQEGDTYDLIDGMGISVKEILEEEAGEVTADQVEFYLKQLSPLTNTTSYNSLGSYNITAIYQETLNYLSSFVTYFVNVAPPVNVLWNSPVLNMGSTFQSTTETDLENITSTGANNNVNVGCVSGDCSVIADLWTDGTNMIDGETQVVDFTCNSAAVGNYSAIFDVVSTEFPSGDQINVSCEVIPTPPTTVSWNSALLDLGNGDRGAGVLTGSENITAIDDHTNVTVVCNTGNCGTITDDWVDGTGMLDAESQAVTFTCNDTTAGMFYAEFIVTSNEDTIVDSIDVDCNITVPIATTGNVVINEFLAINSTPGNDWVELFNNDVNAVDLASWLLNDSSSATAMATLSGVLYPGNFLFVDVTNRLTNTGETIDLIDSTSTVADSYTYGPAQPDISIGRYPDGTSIWLNMTTPTPGASNLPDIFVLWDTTVLDLGQGDQGAGNLTGTSNITSTQTNTQVEVTCLSGNCGAITDDWVSANMTNGESQTVTFTCDDSIVGLYSAIFEVSSDEYLAGSQINVSCEILLVPAYGVSLTDPADLTVDNATNAVYTITVGNVGNVADSFDLVLNNIDLAATAQLNQTTITNLASGASADVTLTVGDLTVGTYAVNVTATSQTDGSATAEIDTLTTVTTAPVYSVNIVGLTANQQVTNTQTAVYDLQVTNTGNQPDTYTLTVNNLDTADTATLNTYSVSLNAGASTTVQLSVADSTPGLYDVTVTATSQTQPASTDTTVNIQTDVVQAVGSMSGTVSDTDNNIYDASVELRQGPSVITSTNTDASGDYSFTNVAIGTYDVVVIKAGFNNEVTQDTISEASNTVHDVTLTPAAFAGSVAGTVLDGTDGTTLIIGATITITRTDNSEVVQIITSDAIGDYVFNGLPPTVGFTYDLDVNVPYLTYTTVFPPTGMSLTSGQSRTGENIYLI